MAAQRKAKIKQIRTCARTMHTRWQMAEEAALQIEEDLGISKRWLPGSAEYLGRIEELACRNYRCTLDMLEWLVIQRMSELTKLGMSSIGKFLPWLVDGDIVTRLLAGYNMRKKISKALKTRADAIHHALEQYNWCAAALTPPLPTLAWHEIMEIASLAEFDLLRDTREDVREFAWAKHLNCQAMNMHFKIECTHEKIARLNVELPQLFTALMDRHFDLSKAIATVEVSDPALAHKLEQR